MYKRQPNGAPELTGAKAILPTFEVGEQFSIYEYDLLQGFSDPEGDQLTIGNFWTDYGALTFDYDANTAYLPISSTETLTLDMQQYGEIGLSSYVPESLSGITLDFYYQVTDGINYTEVSNSLTINAPKPKSYSTIESKGDITLVADSDNYGYAQDASGNRQAIYYWDDQVQLDMWGSYDFIAAENIDGINSLLWEVSYDDGYSYYWLSLHNDQWEYFGSGDVGYEGDPNYGESPDAQFYRTETNFDLDLNNDGRIGAPPVSYTHLTLPTILLV